jgi:3-oxoadipate enol-lactonase
MRLATGTQTTVRQDGDGPPAVLLHGAPLDARVWDLVVPELAHDHRVIRPDLRGHGSAAGQAMPTDAAQLVADVVALLDALDLEHVHLVGHSTGGQIAQAVAVAAPQRLWTLSDVCARSTPFPAFVAAADTIEARGVGAVAAASLARWFTPSALAQDGAAVRYVRECLERMRPATYAAAMRLMAHFDVSAGLPGVPVPSLFVAAEHDLVSGADQLERSAAAVPDARLVVLERSGHMLPLEHPQRLAGVLREHLAAHAPI